MSSDSISRQAAIDAVKRLSLGETDALRLALRIEDYLERLPSAQPENARERTDAFDLPEIIVLNEYDTIESEDGRTGFGVYVPEEKKIYVAGDVPQEMKLKALFHELAHWVQDVSGIDFDEYTANELSEIIYDAVAPEETHDKRTETHACDCISRQAAIEAIHEDADWLAAQGSDWQVERMERDKSILKSLPSAQPDNHAVACLLAELFGDTCACNFNGIDEWLPDKCEYLDACPEPGGVTCWEQFLKHRAERRKNE